MPSPLQFVYVMRKLCGWENGTTVSNPWLNKVQQRGKANLYITVFWPWFPLGFAGIRTGLLCIASMAIYVLRVSQMHSQ